MNTRVTADLAFDQDLIFSLQEQAAQLTRTFLSFCQSVYVAKATASKPRQWKAIQESLGWAPGTASAYAKAGEWLCEIPQINLERLDPKTILALCSEKYRPILERLKDEQLTVEQVKEQMQLINQGLKAQKPPRPVMEWRKAKTGERALIICLEDAEAGAEFESRYKEFASPLPLFVRSLLRGETPNHAWQQAQDELATYMQQQADQVDEVVKIQEKIQRCDRIIAQFRNATNPSEIMVARVAMEDKIKLEAELMRLYHIAA